MTARKIVVLSTADYAGHVWTNKQFIASGLAATHKVHYVESLGLRQPTVSLGDARRIASRLSPGRARSVAVRETPPNLTVHSPLVLPWHRYRGAQVVNRRLLDRLMRGIGVTKTDVLWTFSPVTYDIEARFGAVIYHSVDLLHTIPGIPAEALLAAERSLMHKADAVIASSKGVLEHLLSQGATSPLLWENVAATELYAASMSSDRLDRAIFAGHFTPSKIDATLFRGILDAGLDLAIAGPVTIDGTTLSDEEQAVIEHPRTTYLGNLGHARLAEEVGRSKVGLIPYLVNDYTSGVFPMKVFEYLAGGLSVVSTPLPSLRGHQHRGLEISSGRAFIEAVRGQIETFEPSAAVERSAYAQEFSWTRRIANARSLVESF